jgi:hypothetical protein
MNNQSYQPNLLERLASASVGSSLTSILVTPLDVVKTRMQVHGGPRAMPGPTQSIMNCCREVFFSSGKEFAQYCTNPLGRMHHGISSRIVKRTRNPGTMVRNSFIRLRVLLS